MSDVAQELRDMANWLAAEYGGAAEERVEWRAAREIERLLEAAKCAQRKVLKEHDHDSISALLRDDDEEEFLDYETRRLVVALDAVRDLVGE